MNKKWRPANWVNRQKDFMEINVGETMAYFKNGMQEYESGADDMLAACNKWWIERIEKYKAGGLGSVEIEEGDILLYDWRWQQLKKEIEVNK